MHNLKTLQYAIVLGLICTLAAFGVAGSYRMTRERITEKSIAAEESARSEVVGVSGEGQVEFSVLHADVVAARDATGKVLGYAALGQVQGYGGVINVMVGMDADAKRIIGVKIVKQYETPGLGTRVAEAKSSQTWFGILTRKAPEGEPETMPEFLKQFIGRGEAQLHVGGEDGIQAITGATVSSTAVVDAMRNAVENIRSQMHQEGEAHATIGAIDN